MTSVFAASTRAEIAAFLDALITVYSLLIVVYVVMNIMFTMGVKIPYSRWSDGMLNFVRDVCDPYLKIFRRVIPPVASIDFSPLIGLVLLQILGGILINAIHG